MLILWAGLDLEHDHLWLERCYKKWPDISLPGLSASFHGQCKRLQAYFPELVWIKAIPTQDMSSQSLKNSFWQESGKGRYTG